MNAEVQCITKILSDSHARTFLKENKKNLGGFWTMSKRPFVQIKDNV